MSASKVFLATLSLAAVLVASSAQGANFTVLDGEIWDGTENPHAADGVTLTTTGEGTNVSPFISTYNIPFGMTIDAGATVFLRDASTFDGMDDPVNQNIRTITWDFTGAGGLTFADDTSTIDLFKGLRGQAVRPFTLNMNNNPITGSVAGAGRILSYNHIDDYTVDTPTMVNPDSRASFSLNINSQSNVTIGTVDTTANDANGGNMNIIAAGPTSNVTINNLANGDGGAGGNPAHDINVTATKMTLGNINGQAVRASSGVDQTDVFLRALAQPTNSVGNFAENKIADNSITLDGFLNLKPPVEARQLDSPAGRVTLNAANVILTNNFTYASNALSLVSGAGVFTVNTGSLDGGFTQAQVFTNNSAVTVPNPADRIDLTFGVLHDNVAVLNLSWAANRSGDWNTDTNWTPLAIPNSNQTTVTFGSVITEPQTIFTNSARTVKGITIDTNSPLAFIGTGVLTLETSGGSASLSVLQGNHVIYPQITLLSNTTATAASGTKVDLNGVLNLNGRTLTIVGPGQVNINNSVTGTGSIAASGTTLGLAGSTSMVGDFSSTGALAIDIGGSSSYDSLNVYGSATLSGVLAVDAVDGFAPSPGQTFTVLTANSLDASGLSLGGPDASLFSLINTGNSLVLQAAGAVPEPASALLAVFAALAMTAAARRR